MEVDYSTLKAVFVLVNPTKFCNFCFQEDLMKIL